MMSKNVRDAFNAKMKRKWSLIKPFCILSPKQIRVRRENIAATESYENSRPYSALTLHLAAYSPINITLPWFSFILRRFRHNRSEQTLLSLDISTGETSFIGNSSYDGAHFLGILYPLVRMILLVHLRRWSFRRRHIRFGGFSISAALQTALFVPSEATSQVIWIKIWWNTNFSSSSFSSIRASIANLFLFSKERSSLPILRNLKQMPRVAWLVLTCYLFSIRSLLLP